ncbi:YraN family protein [Taklimakanibacter lacteus]|uniref:YraN family protein n=1 Tax=Taklimakanibacter lacteus TaxID=2268456 RepID=UPI000E667815
MPASSRSKTRRRNERRGRWAERLAEASLRLKGYRLLARRFKSGPGEVDLIMRRGEVTAFIEVKVRANADLAIAAVSDFQIRRIAAAARIWMAKDPRAALGICRFDIVAVSPYQWPRHIPNAFTVED